MEQYDLELLKVIQETKKVKAKIVCVQLPDGLKPMAEKIEAEISKRTGARVLLWLGSNYGACDIPAGLKRLNVDLLICWGHAKFHKNVEGW